MPTIDKARILKKLKEDVVEMRRVNFFLPADLYKDFQEACEEADVPMSGVVKQLLKAFLGQD